MMGWMTGACKTQNDPTYGEFNQQNQKHWERNMKMRDQLWVFFFFLEMLLWIDKKVI